MPIKYVNYKGVQFSSTHSAWLLRIEQCCDLLQVACGSVNALGHREEGWSWIWMGEGRVWAFTSPPILSCLQCVVLVSCWGVISESSPEQWLSGHFAHIIEGSLSISCTGKRHLKRIEWALFHGSCSRVAIFASWGISSKVSEHPRTVNMELSLFIKCGDVCGSFWSSTPDCMAWEVPCASWWCCSSIPSMRSSAFSVLPFLTRVGAPQALRLNMCRVMTWLGHRRLATCLQAWGGLSEGHFYQECHP